MLKIINAFYNNLDVTEILNNKIIDNKLNIHISNYIFGEPDIKPFKKLKVKYNIDGLIKEKIVNDNELLILPTNENNLDKNLKKIEKNIKNIFFYWDGSISESRLKILKDSLYSTRIFNPDRPIYLITNSIEQNKFDKNFNIKVVNWDEYFFYESEIPLKIIKKYINMKNHRDFSDLFRIVLLHKFGGSYIDTDDLCIKKISETKNIICRSYDPHTCHYNNLTEKDCIDGKYREIKGYDHLNMFPRNDCWHNFEPNHYFLQQLLTNKKFLNSDKIINITENTSWQSLTLETITNNIERIEIDFNFKLTLLYLYENFVSTSSSYDMCKFGGEMCDIYKNLPNIEKYTWGNYRCNRNVAEDFYNLILDKYPCLSSLWLHLKNQEKEWFIDIKDDGEYLLSTWIYYFIKEKINNYLLEKKKFSVIIPTLWKSDYIYKLLDDLESSDHIGEIILIDNNKEYDKHINKKYNKINIIQPNKNLYVNKSWNLGVKLSKYDNLVICNDDINFNVDSLEYIESIIDDVGVIGQDLTNFYMKKFSSNFLIEKLINRPSAWGCLIFIKKDKWVDIPSSLKIACGDDFLIDNIYDGAYIIKNFKINGQISRTSSRPEFLDIADKDIEIYKKNKEEIKKVKISVLTLTYQRHDILEEAIKSFLSQDFLGVSEMVIINDSVDVEYVYNNEYTNIRVINCKKRFPSIAAKIEYGYKQCKYDYIYRLDDDDLLCPWALSLTKDYIINNPGYEVYRSEMSYLFSENNFDRKFSSINNGNVYTKSYLDRIDFPDKSIGEDDHITFSNSPKIITLDLGYYTMIYRWGTDTYHISKSQNLDNEIIMNYVDIKEYGTIKLNPNFKKDYYSQLPKYI